MGDRRAHWEGIYQRTTPKDRSWHQDDPVLSLELIAGAGVSPDDPVIDVGGGASVLVDYLIRRSYRNITVLDISASALEASELRLGTVGEDVRVRWEESDVTRFRPERQYALWHDRAVFHFLTEAIDREKYRQAAVEVAKMKGPRAAAAKALDCPGQP